MRAPHNRSVKGEGWEAWHRITESRGKSVREMLAICHPADKALLEWHSRFSTPALTAAHTSPATRSSEELCEASSQECPQMSRSGCCSTGVPPQLRNITLEWARTLSQKQDSLVAISLSTSDAACGVSQALESTLKFTNESFVLLHIGCSSPCTTRQRLAFGSHESPRVWLNHECVPTMRAHGSILRSHLLNVALVTNVNSAFPTPSHLLIMSADMIWTRSGVEPFIRQKQTSAFAASMGYPGAAESNRSDDHFGSSYDDDLEAIAASSSTLQQVSLMHPHRDRSSRRPHITGKHEGSFYPWHVVYSFLSLLQQRGPLGRLNFHNCMCPMKPCSEEVYLPMFAAAQLLQPGEIIEKINVAALRRNEPDRYEGTICARSGLKTSDRDRFAIKMRHTFHQYRCPHHAHTNASLART